MNDVGRKTLGSGEPDARGSFFPATAFDMGGLKMSRNPRLFNAFVFAAPLLIAFTLLSATAGAIPYTAGKYTVDVTVRNQIMLVIPDARVSVWQSGQSIFVEASAPGYQSKRESFAISGVSTYYKQELTLSDITKKFIIEDLAGKPIVSAFVETNQHGFKANEYGMKIFVPIGGWPRPSSKGVDVFDEVWFAPLKTSCNLSKREDFHQVTIVIPRSALNLTTPQMRVVFDTTATVVEGTVLKWVNALIKIESVVSPPLGTAMALAKFIYYTIPERLVRATGRVPRTLQALYDQRARFNQLHQDPEEADF